MILFYITTLSLLLMGGCLWMFNGKRPRINK